MSLNTSSLSYTIYLMVPVCVICVKVLPFPLTALFENSRIDLGQKYSLTNYMDRLLTTVKQNIYLMDVHVPTGAWVSQ